MPRDFQTYFTTTFYTTFPTSDLVKLEKFTRPVPHTYLGLVQKNAFGFKKTPAVLKTKDDFSHAGSYLDPMSDIFAVFQNVDTQSKLWISFEYTFKLEESVLQQSIKAFTGVISYLWKVKDEKKDAEAKEESKPKSDLFMNISYMIESEDLYMKEGLQKILDSVFAPFLAS